MIKHSIGLFLVVMLLTSAAQAAVITQSGVGATEVDTFAGTSHTLNFNLGIGEVITDVNVSVQMSDGDPWGDLDMFITSNGIQVELLSQSTLDDCCQFGDFDVTFDDSAAGTIGTQDFLIGSFKPQFGALSDFNGTALASLWTLDIFEIICCETESDLVAWSVTVTTENGQIPEPGTIALFGLGLAGLGLARRKKKA